MTWPGSWRERKKKRRKKRDKTSKSLVWHPSLSTEPAGDDHFCRFLFINWVVVYPLKCVLAECYAFFFFFFTAAFVTWYLYLIFVAGTKASTDPIIEFSREVKRWGELQARGWRCKISYTRGEIHTLETEVATHLFFSLFEQEKKLQFVWRICLLLSSLSFLCILLFFAV